MRSSVILCFFLICLFNPVFAQQKALLKLQLERGKTYYSEMTVDQTINMKVENNPVSMKQTMGFGYQMVVSKEDDSEQELTTTYEKIRIGMMGMEYDSENPAAAHPTLLNIFKNLVGKSFTIKVDKKGSIYAVSGINEMVEAMVKDLPPNPQAEAMLKSTFNNDKFLEDFSKNFNIFSNAPVKPGDSWKKTISSSFFGKTSQTVNYTLQKLTSSNAGLLLQNTISAELDNMGVKSTLSGEGTGFMEVDRKSGFPLSSVLKMSMSGTVAQQDKTSPIEIIGTYTITGTIK